MHFVLSLRALRSAIACGSAELNLSSPTQGSASAVIATICDR
jgi:hypothetical protein